MGVNFSAEYSGRCYCCYDGRDSEKLEVSLWKYMRLVFYRSLLLGVACIVIITCL
jgi:hypothetical protein